jgi:hypothetical protein
LLEIVGDILSEDFCPLNLFHPTYNDARLHCMPPLDVAPLLLLKAAVYTGSLLLQTSRHVGNFLR